MHSPRAIADKVRNYLSVLVITPSLALVANAGQAALVAYAAKIEWLGTIMTFSIHLAPILILGLGFVAIFMFLPNTRVEFRAAVIGGITSAVLIIVVQSIILKFSASLFQKYTIYGSFASVPIFLAAPELDHSIAGLPAGLCDPEP